MDEETRFDKQRQEFISKIESQVIERVRESLRNYPYGGGDIGIMKEVERIASQKMDEVEEIWRTRMRNYERQISSLYERNKALCERISEIEYPSMMGLMTGIATKTIYKVCHECGKDCDLFKTEGVNCFGQVRYISGHAHCCANKDHQNRIVYNLSNE